METIQFILVTLGFIFVLWQLVVTSKASNPKKDSSKMNPPNALWMVLLVDRETNTREVRFWYPTEAEAISYCEFANDYCKDEIRYSYVHQLVFQGSPTE